MVKGQFINFHNVLQDMQRRVIPPIPQAGPQTVIKSTTDCEKSLGQSLDVQPELLLLSCLVFLWPI